MKQDGLFKALSDSTRRQILTLLKEGDMTHADLFDKFDISKPSLTAHLEKLLAAELIISEKRGRQKFYSLNVSVFEEVISLFMSIFGSDKGEL